MARNRSYTVRYRRRREGRTDYNKRLRYLDSGKIRVVFRRSLRYINLQFIKYSDKGDLVLANVNSAELKKLGWSYSCSNIPAGYLTGLLAGKCALEKGIKDCVFDIGLYVSVKEGVLYAALKGLLDAGVNIPCDKGVLPKDVSGRSIADYAGKLSKNEMGKQFSDYLRRDVDPLNIIKEFELVKGKIK